MGKKRGQSDRLQPFFEKALASQRRPAGYRYLVKSRDGLQRDYNPRAGEALLGARFARKVGAEKDWLEKLISHKPTIGQHYEIIVRNALAEFLPLRYRVGTGFVVDSERQSSSKQLDIVVYDNLNTSPVYQSGDLVVVRPSAVISVSEIKKTLSSGHIRSLVLDTITSNLGTGRLQYKSVQKLLLFAFSSRVSPEAIFAETLEALADFCDSTLVQDRQSGATGHLTLSSIVLPAVYVLEYDCYISCSIAESKYIGMYNISVSVYNCSGEAGALGAFFAACAPVEIDESEGEVSFLTPAFARIERQVVIPSPIALENRVLLADIAEHFPRDLSVVSTFEVNGKRPIAVKLPKHIDWHSLAGFEAILSVQGMNFEYWPETVEADESDRQT